MLNRIILMGRLTRDPELRYTEQKKAVAKFTLAVDRPGKDNKETDFLDFVAFGSTGEYVAKYFTKGRMAVVEGRLQTNLWTDNEGKKRKSVEINVSNMYFADSTKKDDSSQPAEAPSDYEESVNDDDLPF